MTRFEQQLMATVERSRERSAEVLERARKILRDERRYRAQITDLLAREHSGEAAE